jgi:protease I
MADKPQSDKQQAQKQQKQEQKQQAQGQQAAQRQQGPQGQPQQQGQASERSVRGKRVAILATDGFEQVELTEPRKALDAAGAQTRVVSPKADKIRGWNFTNWGEEVKVDVPLDQANPEDFDALLMPGGVMNPDILRMNEKAVAFASAFFEAGKPVASICHGPWMVIETGAADGRRIAAWPSLQTDLVNAGAEWIDEEVCVDGNLVTSRKPDDIPAFNREMLKLFAMSPEEIEQASEEAVEEASVALFVRMEARPGREADVEDLLRTGLSLVEDEPETTSWFGMRLGDNTFAIFDTFPDDSGRQAHLAGRVAQSLQERGQDLFTRPPVIERIDVLACKMP